MIQVELLGGTQQRASETSCRQGRWQQWARMMPRRLMARNKASMTLPSADGSGTMGVAHVKLRSGMRKGVHATPPATRGGGKGGGSIFKCTVTTSRRASDDSNRRWRRQRWPWLKPRLQRAWLKPRRAETHKRVCKRRLQPQKAAAATGTPMQSRAVAHDKVYGDTPAADGGGTMGVRHGVQDASSRQRRRRGHG